MTRVYDGMAAVYSGRGEAGKALELFQKSLDLNVGVEGAELQLAVGAFLKVVSFQFLFCFIQIGLSVSTHTLAKTQRVSNFRSTYTRLLV